MDAVQFSGRGDRYYNDVAFRYERKRRRQDWWHVEQAEMRDLLDGLPRGLSVVDIPFGTGRFVPYYHEFGYNIAGLDASHDMLAAAKKSLGALFDECTCVTGNAAKLPYADGQFDLVVSTRFLRDIVPFAAARVMLAEMARVTGKYAILQLGHGKRHSQPADEDVMGSRMSKAKVDALLKSNDLIVKDRRHVKTVDGEGDIFHVLCEKK